MSSLNLIFLIVVVLVIDATNVQGIKMQLLKDSYIDFFNSLEMMTGKCEEVDAAREIYNSCVENVTTYEVLKTCAITAYDAYAPFLKDKVDHFYQGIIALERDFGNAIFQATAGEPQEIRGIPIKGFMDLGKAAKEKEAEMIRAGKLSPMVIDSSAF